VVITRHPDDRLIVAAVGYVDGGGRADACESSGPRDDSILELAWVDVTQLDVRGAVRHCGGYGGLKSGSHEENMLFWIDGRVLRGRESGATQSERPSRGIAQCKGAMLWVPLGF
jgi:hypothetical protein